MTPVVVLDTSFLIAYHNATDVHHDRAERLMARIADGEWGGAALHELVFLETVTVLALRRGLATAVRVGEHLLASRDVRFVPASDHFGGAWDVFQSQESERLGFVDAAIVAVARALGAPFVATFDRGFQELKGIRVLPEPTQR